MAPNSQTHHDPAPSTFAADIAAEEKSYDALMAQAKSSLARIKELGAEIEQVRESQNSGEARRTAVLSQIESLNRVNGTFEHQDSQMEGSDHIEVRNGSEGDWHDTMGDATEMEVDTIVEEDGSFPELMEKAKRLLARISMNENENEKEVEVEAQARHERAYADLWNPV
ncbi:uncharacterized protein H6S33_010414 [Morchella sextelata]|jgi:hypothetical protein|uniref:uncharacterized protein n=1 Tax=Morchella sextelata TaxID=1174677 RepID=UPI001D04EB74|nr:uncharacterized protein H6S33_010414 [Morchella sextelata]KAH0612362.1 hypothetical protein H6S33_010414 [Morchella sextelata]